MPQIAIPRTILPQAAKPRTAAPQIGHCAYALLIMIAAWLALMPQAGMAAARTAAVFPFEYIDLGEGAGAKPPAAEAERLSLITGLLRDRLADSGLYSLADLAAATPAIEKSPALKDCQRCAEEIARAAGAEIAVVGYVQKVSNLILNINITVSDAQTGRILAAGSADIRGNTDESWTRGVQWLVKNRLLEQVRP
jgi:hypothetical protein